MARDGVVAVYGATGTTGALVLAELAQRGRAALAAGRDATRMVALGAAHGGAVECRVAPLESRAALDALCAAARVVINCAGPFTQTHPPLLDAALRNGCHLVHLSAERGVVEQTFAADDAARAAGVCVVPAAGFTAGCSEVAAWLATRGIAVTTDADAPAAPTADEPDQAAVFVAYNTVVPTVGSLRSYLVDADAPGFAFVDGRWADEAPAAVQLDVELPPPFGHVRASSAPLGDVLTLPRALPLARVRAFLATPGAEAHDATVFTRDRALLEHLRALRVSAGALDEAERARARFALRVELTTRGGSVGRAVVMHGRDPYAVSAALAVEAALALLDSSAVGAHTFVHVVDPQQTLARLARLGVRWTTGPFRVGQLRTSRPPEP